MTIKQLGGVFGRNPTFNDVTIEGELTFDGDIDINSDLKIDGDLVVTGGMTVDSSTLVVDDNANRVGIGTTTPQDLLHITLPAGVNGDIIALGRAANSYQFHLGMTSGSMFYIADNGSNIKAGFPYTGGITFNGDTAAANALDDYEEGTWTGTFSDGTNDATMSASFTTGQYVKIGSMVMVSGYFVNTSIGSMSGAVRITGLPFPSGNANSYSAGGGCAYGASLAITANQSISTYLAKNTDYINLMLWDGAAGASTLQASELSDGGQIVFSLTYIAA